MKTARFLYQTYGKGNQMLTSKWRLIYIFICIDYYINQSFNFAVQYLLRSHTIPVIGEIVEVHCSTISSEATTNARFHPILVLCPEGSSRNT